MASLSLCFVTIITVSLAIVSLQPLSFVSGDDALIATVCGKTVEPVVCSECLKSDPASKTADASGLSKIAVTCTETDTTLLQNDTDKYAQEAKDPASKKLLEDCAIRFFHAKSEFDGIRSNVDAKLYGEAKQILDTNILPEVNYCVEQFDKSPKLPIPGSLVTATAIVRDLCNVVAGILVYLGA